MSITLQRSILTFEIILVGNLNRHVPPAYESQNDLWNSLKMPRSWMTLKISCLERFIPKAEINLRLY